MNIHAYDDWFHAYLLEATRFTPRALTLLTEKQWHPVQADRHGYCACGKRVASGRTLCTTCRNTLRGRLRPPCACGGAYFAAGLCRPCYFRKYNKTRVRKAS